MRLCCIKPSSTSTPLGLSPSPSVVVDTAVPAIPKCSGKPVEVPEGLESSCSAYVTLGPAYGGWKADCLGQEAQKQLQEHCTISGRDGRLQHSSNSCSMHSQPDEAPGAAGDAGAVAAAEAPGAADAADRSSTVTDHEATADAAAVSTAVTAAGPLAAGQALPESDLVSSSCHSPCKLGLVPAAGVQATTAAACAPQDMAQAEMPPTIGCVAAQCGHLPSAPTSISDWVEQQALLSAETSRADLAADELHETPNSDLKCTPSEGASLATAVAAARDAGAAAAAAGADVGSSSQILFVWERVLASSSLQQLLNVPAQAAHAASQRTVLAGANTVAAEAVVQIAGEQPAAASQSHLQQQQCSSPDATPSAATAAAAAAADNDSKAGAAATSPADDVLMHLLTPRSSISSRGSLVGRRRSTTSLSGLQSARQSDSGPKHQHKAYVTDKLLVQLAEAAAGALQARQQDDGCNSSESSSRLLQTGQVAVVNGSASQYSVHRRGYSAAGAMDVSNPAVFSPTKRWQASTSGDLVAAALAYQRQQQQQQQQQEGSGEGVARELRRPRSSSGHKSAFRRSISGNSVSSDSSSMSHNEVLSAASRARLLQQVSAALSAGVRIEDLMQQCEGTMQYSSRAMTKQGPRKQQNHHLQGSTTGGVDSSAGGVSRSSCSGPKATVARQSGSASLVTGSSSSGRGAMGIHQELSAISTQLNKQGMSAAHDAFGMAAATAEGPALQRYQGLEQQWEDVCEQWQQQQIHSSSGGSRQAGLEERHRPMQQRMHADLLSNAVGSVSSVISRGGAHPAAHDAAAPAAGSESCHCQRPAVGKQHKELALLHTLHTQHTGYQQTEASEDLPSRAASSIMSCEHAYNQLNSQHQHVLDGISRLSRGGADTTTSSCRLEAYQNVTTIVWPHIVGDSARADASSGGGSAVNQPLAVNCQQAPTPVALAATVASSTGDVSGCSCHSTPAANSIACVPTSRQESASALWSVSPSTRPQYTITSKRRSSSYASAALDRIQTAPAAGAGAPSLRTASRFHYCPCCNPDPASGTAGKAASSSAYSCTESNRQKTKALSEVASLGSLKEALGPGSGLCSSRNSVPGSESGAASVRGASWSGAGRQEISKSKDCGRVRQLMTVPVEACGLYAVEAVAGAAAYDAMAEGVPAHAAAVSAATATASWDVSGVNQQDSSAAAGTAAATTAVATAYSASAGSSSPIASVQPDCPVTHRSSRSRTPTNFPQPAAVSATAGGAGSAISASTRQPALLALVGPTGAKSASVAYGVVTKAARVSAASTGHPVQSGALASNSRDNADKQPGTSRPAPIRPSARQQASSTSSAGGPAPGKQSASVIKQLAVVSSRKSSQSSAASPEKAASKAAKQLTVTSLQEARKGPSVPAKLQPVKAPPALIGTNRPAPSETSTSTTSSSSKPGSRPGSPLVSKKPSSASRISTTQPRSSKQTAPSSPGNQASPERVQKTFGQQQGIRGPGKQGSASATSTPALQKSLLQAGKQTATKSSVSRVPNAAGSDCPGSNGAPHTTSASAAVLQPGWNSSGKATSSNNAAVNAAAAKVHSGLQEPARQQAHSSSSNPSSRRTSPSRSAGEAVPTASSASPIKGRGILQAHVSSSRPSSTPPPSRGTAAAATAYRAAGNTSAFAAAAAAGTSLETSSSIGEPTGAQGTQSGSCSRGASPSNKSPLHSVHWADDDANIKAATHSEDAAAEDADNVGAVSQTTAVTAAATVSIFSKSSKVSFQDGTVLKSLNIPSPTMEAILEHTADVRALHSCPAVPSEAVHKPVTLSGHATELPSSRLSHGAAAAGAVADGLSGILAMVKQLQGNLAGLESDMHQLHGALHRRGSSMAASGSLKSELLTNFSGELGAAGLSGCKPSPLNSRAQSSADALLQAATSGCAPCDAAPPASAEAVKPYVDSNRSVGLASLGGALSSGIFSAPSTPAGCCSTSSKAVPSNHNMSASGDGRVVQGVHSATQVTEEPLQEWNEQRRIEEACRLCRQSSTDADNHTLEGVSSVFFAGLVSAAGDDRGVGQHVAVEAVAASELEVRQQVHWHEQRKMVGHRDKECTAMASTQSKAGE